MDDDIQTNVSRIRDHISNEGYRLGKSSFMFGFQQALVELLLTKKQLLGKKSAITAVGNIEAFLSTISQEEFRPLAMKLMTTIKRII